MLFYVRTDSSEGIDVNKTSEWKEYDICHYWYFLDDEFNVQPHVCNGCHDLLMVSMNLSHAAILNNKDHDYHCIISGISKIEALNLMQNVDLIRKNGTL